MPLSREDDFYRNNVFSLYDLYGHTLAQEPLSRGVMKIYNSDRPFLGHHYYILSLSDICMGVEKKIFKYINFTLFTPKLSPFGVKGHKITFFFASHPTRGTYQICLRLAQ